MRITLHIGLEKAGSSTIQGFLNENRAFLRKRGVLFPTSPGETNQWRFAAAAMSNAVNIRAHALRRFGDDFAARLADDLRDEITDTSADQLVLSSEHCASRLATAEEVHRLKGFLEQFGTPTSIIVYLRRQDEVLTSIYSTAIRSGHTRRFQVPAQTKGQRRYDYRAVLELWGSVFGRETLRVRLFQPNDWVDGNLPADFCDAAGLPIGDRPGAVRNESMSAEALELLRLINEQTGTRRDRKLIRAAIAVTGGPKLSLGSAARRAFLANFAVGNRWVAETFFGRSELFEAVPDGLPDQPLPQLSPARFASLLAAAEAILARPIVDGARVEGEAVE